MRSASRGIALWCLGLVWLTGWLTACGQETGGDRAESRPVLHYFTWSDYVGPEIIQEFDVWRKIRDVDGSVRYFTVREAARLQTFPHKADANIRIKSLSR